MIEEKYPVAEAIRRVYLAGNDEETLEPHVLTNSFGKPVGRLKNGDFVIFYNLRGEREVALCKSLLDKGFAHFPIKKDLRLNFVTMIPYHEELPAKIAFLPEGEVKDTLSEVLSKNGLRQVKVSEAEKAIHVGYFLNGKKKAIYPGEERIVVQGSREMVCFDQTPEMNASEVADAVIERI